MVCHAFSSERPGPALASGLWGTQAITRDLPLRLLDLLWFWETLLYPEPVSNSLCGQRGPWTSDPLASSSWVLKSYVCNTTLGSLGGKHGSRLPTHQAGVLHTRTTSRLSHYFQSSPLPQSQVQLMSEAACCRQCQVFSQLSGVSVPSYWVLMLTFLWNALLRFLIKCLHYYFLLKLDLFS